MSRKTANRPAAPTLEPLAFNLLCVTTVCVLAAHVAHMPIGFTLALAALLATRWWQRQRHRRRVPTGLRIALLVALPVAVMMVYGTPFGREPGAVIVCGLLVLKVLESERARDARMAVGFACFILMSALLFDQSLGFTIIVGLLLLPALATLRALEPGLPASAWWRAFRPAVLMLGAGLPVALLGFVLVPRDRKSVV